MAVLLAGRHEVVGGLVVAENEDRGDRLAGLVARRQDTAATLRDRAATDRIHAARRVVAAPVPFIQVALVELEKGRHVLDAVDVQLLLRAAYDVPGLVAHPAPDLGLRHGRKLVGDLHPDLVAGLLERQHLRDAALDLLGKSAGRRELGQQLPRDPVPPRSTGGRPAAAFVDRRAEKMRQPRLVDEGHPAAAPAREGKPPHHDPVLQDLHDLVLSGRCRLEQPVLVENRRRERIPRRQRTARRPHGRDSIKHVKSPRLENRTIHCVIYLRNDC